MTSHVHEVRGGLLVPVDPSAWTLALTKLDGKRVTVEVSPWRKSRSAQQNRYLHGVVIPILGEHLGYYADEMRAALAHKFLSVIDERNGLMRIRGTSDLTTVEFEEFMSRVRQWAGEEMGVFVPLPGEYDIHEAAKEAA
jgi:hypothetical protein